MLEGWKHLSIFNKGICLTSRFEFKYVDVIVVALAMTIAFCVILMHLTGMWPCNLLAAIDQHFPIDSLKDSTEPLSKIRYDIHHWLKGLFQCN